MSAIGDVANILSSLSVNAIILIVMVLFLAFLIWNGSVDQVLTTVGGTEIKAVYLPLAGLVYFFAIHAGNQ